MVHWSPRFILFNLIIDHWMQFSLFFLLISFCGPFFSRTIF
jgi:hypothetical protein